MPRSQRNDNFIDKTFTVMADMILKMMPTKQSAKEAFAYYRDGMSAQADGEYAEAMENYEEALKLEEDPYDKSFVLYNMGLIHASNGEHETAMARYEEAESLLLTSFATLGKEKGEQSRYALDAAKRIIDLYEAWGKPEKAREYQELIP